MEDDQPDEGIEIKFGMSEVDEPWWDEGVIFPNCIDAHRMVTFEGAWHKTMIGDEGVDTTFHAGVVVVGHGPRNSDQTLQAAAMQLDYASAFYLMHSLLTHIPDGECMEVVIDYLHELIFMHLEGEKPNERMVSTAARKIRELTTVADEDQDDAA